jgi:hypothetical protein
MSEFTKEIGTDITSVILHIIDYFHSISLCTVDYILMLSTITLRHKVKYMWPTENEYIDVLQMRIHKKKSHKLACNVKRFDNQLNMVL